MNNTREQFSSRLGFVLAAAGSAVGIGNLVGFPVAAAKNGGGAFLLVYCFFVIAICLPLVLAELSLGRQTRQTPIHAFSSVGGQRLAWRLSGILATLTPFMIGIFYTVITVWILGYLVLSLLGHLSLLAEPDYFGLFINSSELIVYFLALLLMVGFILVGGVRGGIERASKLLLPVLFVMLIGLTVFVLTLDNASQGLRFYLKPDLSKLNLDVINGALSQAFFSLSLGMGVLITYGSYLQQNDSLESNGKLIALADTLVAFVAGLMTLPAIFAIYPDTDPSTLTSSSVGLVFSFFPKIFMAMVPLVGYFGASVAACVFFALALVAALTSLVSIIEVPLATVADNSRIGRKHSTLLVVVLVFAGALIASLSFGRVQPLTEFISYGGSVKSLFDLIVDVFYETILPLNGLLLALLVAIRWRAFSAELNPGNTLFQRYVSWSLKGVIPLTLALVFGTTVITKFL